MAFLDPEASEEPVAGQGLRLMLLVVILLAVGVRALVLPAFLGTFPPPVLLFEGSDQRHYMEWAREIASGDPWGESRGVFGFAPLQPYLLAMLFKGTGAHAPELGVALNAFAGVMAALFAALSAWRLFGVLAGGVAGALVGLNGSQLAWEPFALNDPLIPAFLLGGLWCFLELLHRDRRGLATAGWAWGTGLLLGGAIVGRSSNLLPALILWAGLGWHLRRSPARWRHTLVPMALAMILAVAPFVARNGLMHGVWNISGNGPTNLFIGNNRDAVGVFYVEPVHRRQAEAATSGSLTRLLLSDLREDPGYLLPLYWKKIRMFFSAWDVPDNWNSAFSRRHVPQLAALTLDPLWLLAPGIMGLVLTWPRRRRLLPLYGMAAGFAVSIIVIFIAGRFKLPFQALMAIFAGGGVATCWKAVNAGPRRTLLLGVGALGAGLFLCLPRSAHDDLNPRELFPLRGNEYVNVAVEWGRMGKHERVIALLEPFMNEAAPIFINDVMMLLAQAHMDAGDPQRTVEMMEYYFQRTQAPVAIRQGWLEMRVRALARFAPEEKVRLALGDLLKLTPDHPWGRDSSGRAPPP